MKLGIVGVGHLGEIHLKCTKESPFHLEGIFDIDKAKAMKVAKEQGVAAFDSLEDLIARVDAVSIVCDTKAHFAVAQKALLQGKHVFIEKPVCSGLAETKSLVEIANQNAALIVQIGHVERYNPAYLAVQSHIENPGFIEVHRLAGYNQRGSDVSVVYDLMIHDLDILLAQIDSPVKSIHAKGVSIISETADICNARIEFESSCVANLTASRLSLNPMRKFRIFQQNAYLSMDFLEKKSQVVLLSDVKENGMPLTTSKGKKYLHINTPQITTSNAIVEELKDFYNSITCNASVSIGLDQALEVMKLADQIENLIQDQ